MSFAQGLSIKCYGVTGSGRYAINIASTNALSADLCVGNRVVEF